MFVCLLIYFGKNTFSTLLESMKRTIEYIIINRRLMKSYCKNTINDRQLMKSYYIYKI